MLIFYLKLKNYNNQDLGFFVFCLSKTAKNEILKFLSKL